MGRPVNKRYFGVTSGSSGIEGNNFTVNVKVGSNAVAQQGIILKQRSSNKFKVNDAANGSGNTGICKLANKVPGSLLDNEMSIPAFKPSGEVIFLARMFNRTAHDFVGGRWKWAIVDDSSANYIQLTAI